MNLEAPPCLLFFMPGNRAAKVFARLYTNAQNARKIRAYLPDFGEVCFQL